MRKVYIGRSKIAGRGLFAGEGIKKGEFITFLKGRMVYHRSTQRNSVSTAGSTWCSVRKNWWVIPHTPFKFINHSCEPNMGLLTPRKLYSLRDICRGEELTFDYSTNDYEAFWSLPCTCGAKKCRKIIRSVQFLSRKTYESYLPYIPRFFRNVYTEHYKEVKMHS